MEKNNRFLDSLQLPVILVICFMIVHVLKTNTDFPFVLWGVKPRSLEGLKGIFTSPLIHGDWRHLFSNSFPFIGLLLICMYFYRAVAVRGLVMIWILTGIAVWLFADFFFDSGTRNSYHIGASGVVYGLVAFVFWNGIFVRSTPSIVLALVVLVLFGGMFEGISPNQPTAPGEPGISWESHLFGGLVGIFTAYFYKNVLLDDIKKQQQETMTWQDAYERRTEGTEHFLPRDIFDKTKKEREEGEDYY